MAFDGKDFLFKPVRFLIPDRFEDENNYLRMKQS
jgi:hypothetical protein